MEHQSLAISFSGGSSDAIETVVAPTDIQGMRKVKHLTISLAPRDESNTANGPVKWALVYVPQGTTPQPLSANGSLYEPNQFIMNCGIADPSAGPIRISSRIARNLNSGDGIALILKNTGQTAPWIAVVSYAITLQ